MCVHYHSNCVLTLVACVCMSMLLLAVVARVVAVVQVLHEVKRSAGGLESGAAVLGL